VTSMSWIGNMRMSSFLRKFRRNKKAVSGLVIGLVIGLVTLGIVLTLGLYLNVQIHDTMPAMTGAANTTAEALYTNILAAYNLSTIIPIVAAAGAILAVIVGFLVVRSQRTR
jgi:hypothetical protein